MNTATFTFNSDSRIHSIILELLNDPDLYDKIKHLDNDGNPFVIEYEFTEEIDGKMIAIGSGIIDSEEETEYDF